MRIFVTSLLAILFLFVFTSAQEFKLVRILEMPKPELPKNYGILDVQGTFYFKVEFLANGQIGKVNSLTSFFPPLENLALEATKKIKFEPEMNNGERVTVSKIIQYGYSWHGFWNVKTPIFLKSPDEKAEAIIKRAVEKLGGERYLQVKSQVSTGNFTLIAGGQSQLPNSFVDALVFPDKERTEFKQNGSKTVQTNTGETGWLYDGLTKSIKEQSKAEIEDFQRGLRTSLDALLRGNWQGKAVNYVGRRQASVGKRNDVVRLTYADGFTVEYEIADDGTPVRAIYKRKNSNTGEEQKEEDRYAQFVEFQGVYTPLVVDHFIDDRLSSRINYLNIQFNKNISDSNFTKPNSPKELKDLRY